MSELVELLWLYEFVMCCVEAFQLSVQVDWICVMLH